jgi:hypothetical protein
LSPAAAATVAGAGRPVERDDVKDFEYIETIRAQRTSARVEIYGDIGDDPRVGSRYVSYRVTCSCGEKEQLNEAAWHEAAKWAETHLGKHADEEESAV